MRNIKAPHVMKMANGIFLTIVISDIPYLESFQRRMLSTSSAVNRLLMSSVVFLGRPCTLDVLMEATDTTERIMPGATDSVGITL